MKVTIKDWKAVAGWKWDLPDDDVCGICRVPFDACCPNCKIPGDDCPLIWGECSHPTAMPDGSAAMGHSELGSALVFIVSLDFCIIYPPTLSICKLTNNTERVAN
ncbi:ubiquitin-protein ligase Anaphase Promoting Complex [Coemansia erecta]|nr:ubiquitin-protein ligase Anaphase Promoting Complex [Coemansia erecta]